MAENIINLEKNRDLLEKSISKYKTTGSSKPTSREFIDSQKLNSINDQINTLKGKNLREQWYGKNSEPREQDEGLFWKGMEALQRPTSAVLGAGQYLLGQGTKKNLFSNINEAMDTGLMGGDMLKNAGLPRWAQVPLGFALDVTADPISWATFGTSTLIPRVAVGLGVGAKKAGIKGALKTAQKGLTSNVLQTTAGITNMVPFAKKSTKYKNFVNKISSKAISHSDQYDALMGTNIYDKLGKGIAFGYPKFGSISKGIESTIGKVPSLKLLGKETPNGKEITKFFKYSPIQFMKKIALEDKISELSRERGFSLTRGSRGFDFEDVDELFESNAKITKEVVENKIKKNLDKAIRGADGALKEEYFGKVRVEDTKSNAQKLLEVAGEDFSLEILDDIYRVTPKGGTGVKYYDDFIDSLKDVSLGDIKSKVLREVTKDSQELVKTVSSYDKIRNIKPFKHLLNSEEVLRVMFKAAKVPMSIAAHPVAYGGNLFMGDMSGIPTYKPKFLRELVKVRKLLSGNLSSKGFNEMFTNDIGTMLDLVPKKPNLFRSVSGIAPGEMVDKIRVQRVTAEVLSEFDEKVVVKSKILKLLKEGAEGTESSLEDLQKMLKETPKRVASADIVKGNISKERIQSLTSPLEQISKMPASRRGKEFSDWASNELQNAKLDYLKRFVGKKVADKNLNSIEKAAYASANFMLKTMPEWYEKIDQTFKITSVNYLTRIGVNEGNLKVMSRFVDLRGKGDIVDSVVSGGEKLYRLSPEKASEVALEAFMNYAAMPDFVRIARALPVAGSPFISFPYAMAIKTGKTLVNNPAQFNKVGFAINEMNVSRTTEEKVALESKYNEYLNSPSVVRLFKTMNTDAKRVVPYYTLNMINPSDRTYDNSTKGKLLKLADKSPFFQHPVGQVLLDYVIFPSILGEDVAPQGQFGQPLYPALGKDGKPSGLKTKAFYAARNLTEPLIPGIFSYAGLPLGMAGASPELIDYIPSYGIRKLANETQGRSSLGIPKKEDEIRSTFRAISGITGFPLYSLDSNRADIKDLNK